VKILAADTALGACSVAVLDDGKILAHRFEPMDRGHAERLAPMVDEAMREAGIAFRALDRLAVTTGPGTFTGQRVGLAFMRGMRVALKRPLVGVTTLEAMAAAALHEAGAEFAAVLHDAKRGEVYCAVVSKMGVLLPVCLAPFDEAVDAIWSVVREPCSKTLAFAGTAGAAAATQYRVRGGVAEVTTVCQPDALWVARLAAVAPEPAEVPRPLYLRAPDARLPVAGPLR
jgi:tRNA threonylcarbamoyladenosine biosynthesis protein TsaB